MNAALKPSLRRYSTSAALINNTRTFLAIEPYTIQNKIRRQCGTFYGWGRKPSGRRAVALARRCGSSFILLEDGFIRSIGLGVEGAPTFSIIEDDIGIYYDATRPSRLEALLNTYDFDADTALMQTARAAIALMLKHRISKYNHAPDADPGRFPPGIRRVLVIAQTQGDASLTYGLADAFSTEAMIDTAIRENPGAEVYIKIHPDVLCGKKMSDLDVAAIRDRCSILEENLNPISLLSHFDRVYTKTSQMGFEALLLGKKCVCFGMPFYAGWGASDDRGTPCKRRLKKRKVEEIFAAAYILYARYYNPYAKRPSDILDTMTTIARHGAQPQPANTAAYLFGFAHWKHRLIRPFFHEFRANSIHFINPLFGTDHLKAARDRGMRPQSPLYVWGRKTFLDVEAYARRNGNPLYRVEDGFIRSVGLGSDLTRPYSQVVDGRGIYFDPTGPSDLEYLLQHHTFDQALLERAARVRHCIIENKLSKYNLFGQAELRFPEGRTIVLVPGQVEDDASIIYGAPGMTNLTLLEQVRSHCPDAYIVFKPHPDVLMGNRAGAVFRPNALRYCDRIIEAVGIDTVLRHADAVHTMTSLVGFEALLRGKAVTTYGLPFYAGWGLTKDRRTCSRRTRTLSLDALVAGVLLLYPRYVDPATLQPCEIEVVLDAIKQQQKRYNSSSFYRTITDLRNGISRKMQTVAKRFRSIKIGER